MSFDGVLLHKLLEEFNILKTGRISKIVENGTTDFILTIRPNRSNYNLMLSFSSNYARIHFTDKKYDTVLNPRSITMLLRKHIEGYFIDDIYTFNNDRVITFKLTGYNEMQVRNTKYLICEIMGRYSNMILTDNNFVIIEALKRDGVGEFNRTILPNATYEYPQNNKLDPYSFTKTELISLIDNKDISTPKDYMDIFNGVSAALASYVCSFDNHQEAFYDAINLACAPSTFKTEKGKLDFYFHPLNNEVVDSYQTISMMLDEFYYKVDLQAKVRLKTNDLKAFVERQLTRLEKKKINLANDLKDALNSDKDKLYGELLLSYPHLKEKHDKVTVLNYYTNENITISLDPKLDVIGNSSKYYKKYQKAKNAVNHLEEQIKITENEIEYFTVLRYQISNASINEALEIQDELIENKYLLKKTTKNNNRKQKMKLLTYELDNGTLISVGKNNLQNEYLTHKLATGNEMWFHIQKGAGSHVVVHNSSELTEEEIRTGAILAAYYSSYSDSSSVAVDYTRIRTNKKVPGKKGSFVIYTNQKTIYIDPDINIIKKLKEKR